MKETPYGDRNEDLEVELTTINTAPAASGICRRSTMSIDIEEVDLSADVPLDTFLRRVSRITEKRFNEMGEVDPSWALVTAGGQAQLVVMSFPETIEDPYGDKIMKAGVAFMRDYFKEHDVVRYAFVAEAWRRAESASVRSNTDPNRTELVILVTEDCHGAIRASRQIVRAENGMPYLGNLELDDGTPAPGYSQFGNLLYQTRPRSSSELPDDVGTVFVTNVPDAPFQILGRRGPTGELFVGRHLTSRDGRTTLSPEELAALPFKVEVVAGAEGQKLISDVVRWLPKN
jgi:hypothetical protein